LEKVHYSKYKANFGGGNRKVNLEVVAMSFICKTVLHKAKDNYRFGNAQVKVARQRKASIEEENKRTQKSSGEMGGGGNLIAKY
jgi:hypothetical protein